MSKQGSAGNVLAALCSLIVPGLGQLLQARLGIAILHFFLAIILWVVLLGWAVHLWSVLDAAMFDPEANNRREKNEIDIKIYERKKSFDSEIAGVRECLLTAEGLTDPEERTKVLSRAADKLQDIKNRFEQYPTFESQISALQFDIDRLQVL